MLGNARRVGVIDRNISPGSGGIFWLELCGTLRQRSDVILQGYLTGLGGGDVTPAIVDDIAEDLTQRTCSGEPAWKVPAYAQMF